MTCRIDRLVTREGLLILHISGQITGKDVDLLRSVLEQEKGVVAIDLKDVLLVDRGAIKLLALSELNGAELRNCPAYIREWVTRERAVINAPGQWIEASEDTEGA
jgi:ABC-type transporter Mla MlaB component